MYTVKRRISIENFHSCKDISFVIRLNVGKWKRRISWTRFKCVFDYCVIAALNSYKKRVFASGKSLEAVPIKLRTQSMKWFLRIIQSIKKALPGQKPVMCAAQTFSTQFLIHPLSSQSISRKRAECFWTELLKPFPWIRLSGQLLTTWNNEMLSLLRAATTHAVVFFVTASTMKNQKFLLALHVSS